MFAAAVGDTSGLRGLGLGLGLGMKFRSFSAPTMLRKLPRGIRKGFCVLASNVQSIRIAELVRG